MRVIARRQLLLVGAQLLVACSDGGAPSSGSMGTGASGTVGDAGSCGPLMVDGPTVRETRLDQMPPTPTGGVIASGQYRLTSYTVYTGPGGAAGPSSITYRASFAFSMTSPTAGTIDFADSRIGGPLQYTCGPITTMGTKFTMEPSRTGPLVGHYSATATEIQLQTFSDTDGTTVVSVLEKQ